MESKGVLNPQLEEEYNIILMLRYSLSFPFSIYYHSIDSIRVI
ncbi:Hypothetical protein ETEE_3363 [Edwardsiella anguillarum ET080813]|uniref:Uncharacterized protein n=1 Tax=Edwardsiella anguillarum ET080813 TaxID=667120 RepID=A0A076LMQ5_9GAMM|nr:Hypothetical protein ETEE_3363 [Edwardsiella anguillarum ET080813]